MRRLLLRQLVDGALMRVGLVFEFAHRAQIALLQSAAGGHGLDILAQPLLILEHAIARLAFRLALTVDRVDRALHLGHLGEGGALCIRQLRV